MISWCGFAPQQRPQISSSAPSRLGRRPDHTPLATAHQVVVNQQRDRSCSYPPEFTVETPAVALSIMEHPAVLLLHLLNPVAWSLEPAAALSRRSKACCQQLGKATATHSEG